MDYLTITGGTVTARANGKNGYGLNTYKDKGCHHQQAGQGHSLV